jgi:hypothetical protein
MISLSWSLGLVDTDGFLAMGWPPIDADPCSPSPKPERFDFTSLDGVVDPCLYEQLLFGCSRSQIIVKYQYGVVSEKTPVVLHVALDVSVGVDCQHLQPARSNLARNVGDDLGIVGESMM